MRIDPKEKIAEVPIVEVRKLLKYVDNETEWGKNRVTSLLKISPPKPRNSCKNWNGGGILNVAVFLGDNNSGGKRLKAARSALHPLQNQ